VTSADRAPRIVVMVLENSHYPLDARVRMEAETLESVWPCRLKSWPRARPIARSGDYPCGRVTRFPLPDGNGRLFGTAIEYSCPASSSPPLYCCDWSGRRGGTLARNNPPDFFFPCCGSLGGGDGQPCSTINDDAAGMLHAKARSRDARRIAAGLDARALSACSRSDGDDQRHATQARPSRRPARGHRAQQPTMWFAEHRPSPPIAHGVAPGSCFLGEIGVQDRVQWTVDILAALVGDRQLDAELLIIGDGPQRQAVQEHARELARLRASHDHGMGPFRGGPTPARLRPRGSRHRRRDRCQQRVDDGQDHEYLVVGIPVVATALRETRVTGADAVVTVAEDTIEAYVAPIAELLGSSAAWQAMADRAQGSWHGAAVAGAR